MSDNGIIGIILIIANVAFSYKGFTDQHFFERYMFEVDKVLINKDYKRIVTSGFLHINWTHLIFNMFSLLIFSGAIESELGPVKFLVVYFVSLIGGNLFSLIVHQHHGDYSAAGASGAISGVIFASIALFPGMGVGLFLLPAIPAWLYGILFVLYSIYGIRSKKDNIGHEAHLGGALVGMITGLVMQPTAFIENYVTILIIVVPTIIFIYLIITRPQALLIDNLFFKKHSDHYSVDHKYNADKHLQQKEIDRILDKINRKGIDSLTGKERSTLKKYS
ncbi:MAG: rhomboid family intramembrane serine protease [Ferruginibacter sp.]